MHMLYSAECDVHCLEHGKLFVEKNCLFLLSPYNNTLTTKNVNYCT